MAGSEKMPLLSDTQSFYTTGISEGTLVGGGRYDAHTTKVEAVESPTFKGQVPERDLDEGHHTKPPPITQPPPDLFCNLPGYDGLTAEETQFPLHRSQPLTMPVAARGRTVPPPADMDERQARSALLNEVSQHCCWGKGVAQQLTFTSIVASSAFHYVRPSLLTPLPMKSLPSARHAHCRRLIRADSSLYFPRVASVFAAGFLALAPTLGLHMPFAPSPACCALSGQKLESFTEDRFCAWVYEPYRGQPVEGPDRTPYVLPCTGRCRRCWSAHNLPPLRTQDRTPTLLRGRPANVFSFLPPSRYLAKATEPLAGAGDRADPVPHLRAANRGAAHKLCQDVPPLRWPQEDPLPSVRRTRQAALYGVPWPGARGPQGQGRQPVPRNVQALLRLRAKTVLGVSRPWTSQLSRVPGGWQASHVHPADRALVQPL